MDAEMRVDGVQISQILDDYERQCRTADEIIAEHALDDVAKHPEHGHGCTLRWILFHMIEESARHAGHADAIHRGMSVQHVSGRRWRKSSYSNDTANCVEVAFAGSAALVRDSKDPAGPTLHFPARAWSAFLVC